MLYVVIYQKESRPILSGVFKTREEAEEVVNAIKAVDNLPAEIWEAEEEG